MMTDLETTELAVKILTEWGPLSLGWVGFFGLLALMLRRQKMIEDEQRRREEAQLKALMENTRTLSAVEKALDKLLIVRPQ